MNNNILGQIDAIAYGVEARYELDKTQSRLPSEEIVTDEVVFIARKLRIPEVKIARWAAARKNHSREKTMIMESLRNRGQMVGLNIE